MNGISYEEKMKLLLDMVQKETEQFNELSSQSEKLKHGKNLSL